MGVDIVDVVWGHASVAQGLLEAEGHPARFRIRLRHVVGIRAHAVADDLSVNGGSTSLRLLEFF